MKRRYLAIAPLLLACGGVFYQAPPPLDAYPARVAGKSWLELFRESHPAPAGAVEWKEMIDLCDQLSTDLPGLPKAERKAKIEAALARNREGDFRLRAANFLHELSELAEDDELLVSAKDYLAWQTGRLSLEAGFIRREPVKTWMLSAEEFAEVTREYQEKKNAATEWIEQALAGSPEGLKPHLMVQKGAIQREYGDFLAAAETFASVVEQWPDHPRATVAGLMRGRCLLEQARAVARRPRRVPEEAIDEAATPRGLLIAAHETLEGCLARDPKGPFAADVAGWLGAVALEQGRVKEAIRQQLRRLEIQPTREVRRSVLRECDLLFTRLFEELPNSAGWDSDLPVDLLMKYPEILRLLVGHALDPLGREELPVNLENTTSDRITVDFLTDRVIRPLPAVRRGLSQLGQSIVRHNGISELDDTSLLILGWACYLEEQPAEAIALFDRMKKPGFMEDERLQGRALSLAALGRHREAAEAYGALAKMQPKSPLAAASAFDHALARFRSGEAGEALLMILAMVPEQGWMPVAPLRPEYEPIQWIDTIAQFAPLEELAAPLKRLPVDHPHAHLLRTIVRTRALCAEDFARARLYLDPPGQVVLSEGGRFPSTPRGIGLNEAVWQQEIESLAGATEVLSELPAGQKERRHLQIARKWKSLRGRLTLPLHEIFDYSGSEGNKLELLRRRNALHLGLDPAAIAAELDSRDELQHAIVHFLAAAESRDPDVAAPALEEANEALFQLSFFSHYRCLRAVEENAGARSRAIVERLKRDFPDRPETARAVSWEFTSPSLLVRWMPGDYSPGNSAEYIKAAVADPQNDWRPWRENPGDDQGERLRTAFAEFVRNPGEDMPAVKVALAEYRRDFESNRGQLEEEDLLAVVDDLDDLTSAADAPGISADLFRRYADIRVHRQQPPAAEGEWLPFAPWLKFLERIRPAPSPDGRDRAHADTVASWEGYLSEFPGGPKSEAASLRLLRLKVRAVSPIPQVQAYHFPDAPIQGGYKRLRLSAPADRSTLRDLARELDQHETRFPGGRYQADIKLLRASVAADAGDPALALKCLTAVLADPSHPELRMNAALQFSQISLGLLDLRKRTAVAAAFRQNREAMPFLRNLAYGETCLFLLRPLLPWLEQDAP